jgi:Cytochrome c554 and c-prime
VKVWLIMAISINALAAQYAGSQACASCHLAEWTAQSKSEHALALARSSTSQPGDWAFGAGSQAITFVSRLNGTDYLEHGESWYRASNAMGITPGHQNTDGLRYRVFDPSAGILRCFACHSTGPLKVGEKDGLIVPDELGVRCEVCHGPGAAHAANPKAVRVRNPGKMDGPQMNELCGECHRVQSSVEDGSNLLDPWNSRHQPLLIAASECFQKSKGRLSCINCHSPHAALDTKLTAYNPACLKCHPNVQHAVPVQQRACAECHMPSVRINANLAFANHRIAIYSPNDALSPRISVSRPSVR